MNKKLERKSNKLITGVGAGLADYFGIDVTIMRLIMVALLLLDGSGTVFIAYIVASFLIPKAWDYSNGNNGGNVEPSAKEQAYDAAA